MGKEEKNRTNNDEEIDLGVVFGKIREFFRLLLKTGFSVLDFYLKKKFFFSVLVVLSLVFGFLIDKYWVPNETYEQEIVIEPKFRSTKYLYDEVHRINKNINDSFFHQFLQIDSSQAFLFENMIIEPIIHSDDILDYLRKNNNSISGYDFLEELNLEQLDDEKYYPLYKYHRLKIIYKNKNEVNSKTTELILDYLKNNKLFKKEIQLVVQGNKRNLKQNKASLQFIEDYLKNINRAPIEDNDKILVFSEEESAPTVASLLKQKEIILKRIDQQERDLSLKTELFSELYYGEIQQVYKGLLSRYILRIPILLLLAVSSMFMFKFFYDEAKKFIS